MECIVRFQCTLRSQVGIFSFAKDLVYSLLNGKEER